MHVLFVHQNYPAQFGHVAEHLAARHAFRCTFVSEKPAGRVGNVERIQYASRGGATKANHYCSRTFENAVWHTDGVYAALKARPDIRPDLVVGHSGFGSTLFLKELYPDVPVVNLFEFFYRATGSDMDFRPDFPSTELNRLRAKTRCGTAGRNGRSGRWRSAAAATPNHWPGPSEAWPRRSPSATPN